MKLRVVLIAVCVTVWSASAVAHRADEEARVELARQQGQLINDVQALQMEVAQLRDMVERQKYELSKFKQAEQSRPVGQNYPNNYPNNGQPQYVPTEQGLVLVPSQPPAGVPTNQTFGAQGYPSGDPNAVSAAGPEAMNDLSVDQGGDGFGQPAADETGFSNQNIPVDPNASPDFPPVEERRIGYGTTSTTVIDPSPMPTGTGDEGGEGALGATIDGVNAAPNIAVQPIEQLPAAGGAVIALPGATSNQAAANGAVNSQAEVAEVDSSESDAISASLDESELYQNAFNLLRQSKHSEAVTVFTEQIKAFPYGDYADDANYWIAESKYVNRDLAGSKKFFKVILDDYKQSPRLPDAMLKIAYIEQEQGNVIEAGLLLQEVLQYHPRSNAAISAKNRLAELDS